MARVKFWGVSRLSLMLLTKRLCRSHPFLFFSSILTPVLLAIEFCFPTCFTVNPSFYGKYVEFSMGQQLLFPYFALMEIFSSWKSNRQNQNIYFKSLTIPEIDRLSIKVTGLHTLLLILCDPRKCGNGLQEIGVIQPLLGGRLSQDRPWRLPGLFFWALVVAENLDCVWV